MQKRIQLPLTEDIIKNLRAGDNVLLSGVIFVARDAAHKRLVEALDRGQGACLLTLKVKQYTIWAFPGQTRTSGAAGPTTSGGWIRIHRV